MQEWEDTREDLPETLPHILLSKLCSGASQYTFSLQGKLLRYHIRSNLSY